MKLPRKLQDLLGLVPMSDYNELTELKDRIINARHTAEEQAINNSKLCADLVEECNSQGKIIDELTDENAKLKEHLSKLADDYAKLEEETNRAQNSLDATRDALDATRDALDHIWGLADYALQQGEINDGA